ncbi:predicted protein [Sclerotinia sclerotiorum 1980 UF-70]|uniref:Uncharacterized protein n=1 Tax=Sclerotinia sclerotiorum (strain ATCC 18683 / 1980 / Ss-1) TaxID=665079 RepID=A7F6C3_SCLS1|nr:predicted protein [Sclerotinia sclerotiorum 1980 UF-70]EDN98294.1 predicted protein [Sclerotinia sclerotiorum 1980 UF-70]
MTPDESQLGQWTFDDPKILQNAVLTLLHQPAYHSSFFLSGISTGNQVQVQRDSIRYYIQVLHSHSQQGTHWCKPAWIPLGPRLISTENA